ncbi:MAG TPA: ATP-binding protein, partial [Gammaproteobacteria bacterium]|nr:ATP-binding protein [Gammaproteobacteria bacterium]
YRPTLGMKHPRALGMPAREVWSEFWDDVLRPLLEGVLVTGEALWANDYPFALERHGYPEETYFDISYDPVRDESGRVGGVFCIVSETTGRVLGERRLRTLRELGRATAEARTPADVFRLASGVLEKAREDVPFALLYGWQPEQGLAQRLAAIGIAPGRAAPDTVRAGDAAAAWPLEKALGSDGLFLDAEALAPVGALPGGRWPEPARAAAVLPITMPSQAPYGFLVAGISPRRALDDDYRDFLRLVCSAIASAVANADALEAERKRAEALAELDRAKTSFFSNVSHEFRTPLTLLLGPLEDELAARAAERPPDRERLDTAHRNALRLLKLVNTLLDFSRIEAGRAQATYVPTDLAALTAQLASNFRSACDKAELRLVVDCPALEEPVYVDRDMWEKIVLNLLSNAFKFTFAGEIEVTLACRGEAVELGVRDTGVGIAAEHLPRLFERFHRIEGTRARTHEGSGIGLSLVRELVRMHGGEIRAASEPGKGTCFTVSIPLGRAHLAPEHVGGAAADRPAGTGAAAYVQEALGWLGSAQGAPGEPQVSRIPREASTARLLVADDNADMREYLRGILQPHWSVTVVADGEQALAALREARFEAVIADIMMPRMDGFTLLRAIKTELAALDLPVILLSARAGEEARIEGLEAGADEYLVKPFAARELVAVVRSQLTIARARANAAAERNELLSRERAAKREAELQREHLESLFMQAPNPIVILRGDDYLIDLANAHACGLWKRQHQDVIGKPLFEAVPELRGQ